MKVVFRLLVLTLLAGLALQLYFAGRIALMRSVNPESTAFQRSEVYAAAKNTGALKWRQQWGPYTQVSDHLKRAIIASEDSGFIVHDGVDMQALEKAWDKNEKNEKNARAEPPLAPPVTRLAAGPARTPVAKTPKLFGGSTITQQLAKNLFLSGERTFLRKGQELLLALMLEALLNKQRILEIYLNSVEWGEGVYGAEAASQHYYRKPALQLNAYEAARLAVMLPRPKYFETRTTSGYLASRARIITARMGGVEVP